MRKLRWLFDFSDVLHYRQLKIILLGFPAAFTVFMTIIAVFSFFVGNHYEEGFPLFWFWLITIFISAVAWVVNSLIIVTTRMADPYMQTCTSADDTTVFYIFKMRKGVKDNTLVEVRKVQNGNAIPFALAYTESQDMLSDDLVVRPLAYVRDGFYVKMRPRQIPKNKVGKYVLYTGPIKKDMIEGFMRSLGGEQDG